MMSCLPLPLQVLSSERVGYRRPAVDDQHADVDRVRCFKRYGLWLSWYGTISASARASRTALDRVSMS